jgi:hypothetical protein
MNWGALPSKYLPGISEEAVITLAFGGVEKGSD